MRWTRNSLPNQPYSIIMKNAALSALLLAGLLFNASCSSKNDSKDMAENANDNKIENNESGAAAMTANSTGDAKDVSEYMVDLANTGMTELEMSKVAASKAVTPGVKDFASKTVSAHAQDDQKMKDIAGKYNITLPSTLSNDSQDMLTKLNQQTAGADFDKQYLNNMADINDNAVGKAKDLVDNADKPDLKSFAENIVSDDTKHRDEAKQLMNNVK